MALPAWRSFQRALYDPAAAQERVLRRILDGARHSAFVREHDLRDPADLRRVPVRTWEELSPWVDRVIQGEPRVLCDAPITRFEPTSGTSSARKLVPSTAPGRRELSRAVQAWMVDTFARDPRLLGGPSYWSISPTLPAGRTPGGVPIGFDTDAGTLGGLAERVVARTLVSVPRGLQGEDFWRATAIALLRARELRLISIWNPSFGLLLHDAVRRHWDEALRTLPARVASRIDPDRPWPALRLISTWGDAAAAAELPALKERFPGIPLQEKGLLATEGIVSVPFAGQRPLALTSHLLELLRDDGSVIPAWRAEPGEEGVVVLTTGHGLWRYRLGDRVRVTGRLHATPTVRFLGREGAVVDTRGEKLGEAFVTEVLARLGVRGFALLAPEDGGYVLYAVEPPDADALESALRDNPHYAWCVSLGQLRSARVERAHPDAAQRYVARLAAEGRRHGDVKPAHLSGRGGWRATLVG
ncbi:MAG: GH3 auxin-responsive promoter family protein [Myxococcales bacterium]|nr:GH3 auxin-responsive promoter family protein [Myxococcales bacterium]